MNLSGRAFATVRKSFAGEVVNSFQFLVSEFGFNGPEFDDTVIPGVAYAGRGIRCEILLDLANKTVTTQIEVQSGNVDFVADVKNLVQAAGLGALNQVRRSAHTLNALRQTLESHAKYVRQLQSHLTPQNGIELMRAADAREWHVPRQG